MPPRPAYERADLHRMARRMSATRDTAGRGVLPPDSRRHTRRARPTRVERIASSGTAARRSCHAWLRDMRCGLNGPWVPTVLPFRSRACLSLRSLAQGWKRSVASGWGVPHPDTPPERKRPESRCTWQHRWTLILARDCRRQKATREAGKEPAAGNTVFPPFGNSACDASLTMAAATIA